MCSRICPTRISMARSRSCWCRTISRRTRQRLSTPTFPAAEARRLSERFEWHYTPKHGSWLDMAECELGVLATQCLNRRIPDKPTLSKKVAARQKNRNRHHVKADWRFTTDDARVKLKPSTFSSNDSGTKQAFVGSPTHRLLRVLVLSQVLRANAPRLSRGKTVGQFSGTCLVDPEKATPATLCWGTRSWRGSRREPPHWWLATPENDAASSGAASKIGSPGVAPRLNGDGEVARPRDRVGPGRFKVRRRSPSRPSPAFLTCSNCSASPAR